MTRTAPGPDAPPATPDEVRTRRGAHRARPEPLRVLVPGLLLAVVIGGGAAALNRGEDPGSASSASTRPLDAAVTPTPRPTPSAPRSQVPVEPGDEAGGEADDQSDDEADGKPSAGPDDEAGDTPVEVGVVVLNQTGISGLAARVGSDLTDEGWEVTGTGNFRGRVPSTTVYYPSGMQRAAEKVAADLPGPDRVRPVFGNLSRSRLTVVVTEKLG